MLKQMSRITGLLSLFILMGALNLCLAQGSQGNISGTVRDSSGAVVTGATVEVTNQATNEKRTATTNDQGVFSVPNLNVGLYTVAVTQTGFAASTVKDVKVSVSFTSDTDVVLNAAGASETVTVSTGDAATQLNTTDQQLSTIIENKKIIDLPLLSRDPSSLILLSPGTVQTNSGLGGFAVNGQRERNNNFLVDGIDNNDADVPGIPGGIASPNIDATQEFRVITNNFNAEYGRNSGAIITIATKNGTNEFHGNGYIYYRSDAFNARNFFNAEVDPQQRKQFGGSIGGPIIKDKAFFFFNYEGDRFDQGFTVSRTVPTARARLGLFDFGGALGTINANANSVYGITVRPQQIALLNALYPLPNRPGQGTLPGIFETFVFSSQTNNTSDSIATRVDYRLSEKNNLTGSFNYGKGSAEFCCESFPTTDDSIKAPFKTYLIALNLTTNVSPNMINEARIGANRAELAFNGEGDPGVGTGLVTSIRNSFIAQGAVFPAAGFGGANGNFVGIGISGPTAIAPFDTQFRFTGTTVFADSMTMVTGDHTLKFGFEHRRVYANGASNFGRAENIGFNYPTTFGDPLLFTNDPANFDADPTNDVFVGLGGTQGTVQNFTSFLFGLTDQQNQSQFFNSNGVRTEADYKGFRTREWDFFIQDTWRLRPNFTLNYGLRYEFKGVPFEVNGQISTLVDQDPSGPLPAGGFRFDFVGKNSGNKENLYSNDYNNFAPRFGFNYSPAWEDGWIAALTGGPGKTSIRGGYGVFYDRVYGNLFSNASANPPFNQAFQAFTGDFIENIPRPPTQTPSRIVQNDTFLFPVIFALPGNNIFQRKFANPYTQAWNFGFQRQFGNTLLIEADYVGNKGTNQLRVIDGQLTSVPRVTAITGRAPVAISPTGLVTNYFNGTLNTAFFQVATNLSVGQSNYHALQTRITKTLTNTRFGLGEFQAAYTWSHAIDDSTDALVGQAGERTFPRDSTGFAAPGNGFRERGNAGFDTRHRLVMNFRYEIPLNFENNFVDAVFGNWAISGIWQWQSGNPYSVFGGIDSAGTALSQRADFADPNAIPTTNGFTRLPATTVDPRTQTGPTRDLFRNPCAGVVTLVAIPGGFQSTCTGQFNGRQGGIGRSAFVGPDFNKFDLSIMKRIPFLREGTRFTVRADFYNLFNRVNFGQPVNTINSSNFGQSTTAGAGRIVQFVGRFEF